MGGHAYREFSGTLRADPGDNAMSVAKLRAPVAFGIGSDGSKGMLSDNPRAGIYEAETSRTLDRCAGNLSCNQGGIAVVAPAYSIRPRPRLNTGVQCEASPTLMARDYKDPPIVSRASGMERPAFSVGRAGYSQGANSDFNISVKEEQAQTLTGEGPGAVAKPEGVEYIVRRLTTGECCALQGYPFGWTENLGTDAPTDDEIMRWAGIFQEWYRAQGKEARPPSMTRIMKWLKEPRSDTAEYKAYGNSIAVPCAFFVLAGIVWAAEREGRDAY